MPDSVALLVVQHEDNCPPALFADWLGHAGIALDVRRPYRGDALPASPSAEGHAGLLVLGGSMGAHDDDRHPWLAPTKALIRAAVEDGTPTLGICLGHQLAAVALGGTSRPSPDGQNAGVRPVGWSGHAAGDALFGALARTDARVAHWNGDVVTDLPERASVLARTADGAPQVLRYGERAWSVQFHPEADHAVISVWVDGDRRRAAEHARAAEGSVDLDEALQQVKTHDERLRATGRRVADAFAGIVRRRE